MPLYPGLRHASPCRESQELSPQTSRCLRRKARRPSKYNRRDRYCTSPRWNDLTSIAASPHSVRVTGLDAFTPLWARTGSEGQCTAIENCGNALCDSRDGENWVFGGVWEFGTPSFLGEPDIPHSGLNVIGTVIGADYMGSCAYLTDLVESPAIDLSAAVSPVLHFYMWVNTEPNYDCGALFISVDGGVWNHLSSPSPAYTGLEGGYVCWGGADILSWQEVSADLSAYVGQSIRVGFGFYSDSIVNYEGWYIDDVMVAEPAALP